MNIHYEWYRTFYTVVKEGSFSKAAEALFVTQPAISQAIRQLEEQTGVKLFIRRSRSLPLTEAGRQLFAFIARGMEHFQAGENYLQRLNNPLGGEVTLGISEAACRFFLLPHLKELGELYPDIKLKIREGATPQSIEALQKGEIDCAIVLTPHRNIKSSIQLTTIKKCHFGLFASEVYMDKPSQPLSLKEYAHYPFLLLDEKTATRKTVDTFLKTHDTQINIQFELSSVGLIKDFVKLGFGLSILPEDYLQQELKEGSLIALPLREKLPHRDLSLATFKEMPLTPGAKTFINFLISRMRQT